MRKKESLNQGWMFYKEGKAWQIDLPHTWNALDGTDGGDDYYRGCCYYEKEFDAPNCQPGEQVWLEFEGVGAVAEVTVNGVLAGRHEGGYSMFRCNITGLLKEHNILKVAADNSANTKIYPQKADFTFYGGIYRDVWLVVVPDTHFALGHYGSPGVKVTPVLQNGRAEIIVEVWLEWGGKSGFKEAVEVVIADREGIILSKKAIVGLRDGSTEPEEGAVDRQDTEANLKPDVVMSLNLENPHLWQGVEDPYLYRLTARLLREGEAGFCVIDEVSLRFGCRSFTVDPNQGFFLNGKSYPLRGVSRHQDREGVGNALTRRMNEEDMEMIREIGANSIRLAHYQHSQQFYDLCDEYGMVVWAEIPYITCHMDEGRENTLSQMKELIVQNHHHASICFWGISNEVTVGGVTEKVLENNRELHNLCKKLDPGRLTTMACAFMLEDDSPMLDIPDLVSYNHYFGWYQGEAEDNDAWFDSFREKHPHMPVGLSEYGAEAVLKWQTARPERGDYTEQYQAVYHEHMLAMVGSRPWIWCSYVWNMFDFGADGRDEGGVRGRNNKGLVTFDRKIKKDAFYLYKAFWSKEPFVYITGRRYVNRAEKVSEIKVYSNQSKVELYQNGRLIGLKNADYVFHFQVKLEPENILLAKAGELQDCVTIYGVEREDPSYVLPVQGEVENWFGSLADAKEGYFSLEDRVGDLVSSPEGLQILWQCMIPGRKEQPQHPI